MTVPENLESIHSDCRALEEAVGDTGTQEMFSFPLPAWREEKVSDNALVVELVLARGFLFLWPLDPILNQPVLKQGLGEMTSRIPLWS